MKKRLVVISGVTGAIGSALLAEYGQGADTVIYGISRKALPFADFLNAKGKLPLKTLICSLELPGGYGALFKSIEYSEIEEIIYVHALGFYPFETDKRGEIAIRNDADGDGVNDRVMALTYEYFKAASDALRDNWQGRIACIIFGAISDRHSPAVHASWCKTIEKTKRYMREKASADSGLAMLMVNISSVLCPHEIITRPFVFTHTDADLRYWLPPHELARFVLDQTGRFVPGFREVEKFRAKPGFEQEAYYSDAEFTPRKVRELFG